MRWMTALEKEEGQRVRVVRVFVSSPGDVEHERRRVDRVAERLNGEFAGIARIETIRQQNSFYGAPADFQGRIPEADDCDVVIAIFWSRLGPELPPDFPRMPDGEPYPSATAYDVLTAIAARESKDAPDVFVFRKNEPPRAAIDDDEELEHAQAQWKRLRTFLDRRIHNPQGHTVASVRRFESADQFEGQVDALLRDWLETHVPHGRSMIWPIAIRGSPFRGLACFDVEHAPVFFGRARDVERAMDRLLDRLKAASGRGSPFLLVVGPSGAGKSSLVRAGLVPRLTAPGVAAGVDAWRVALMRPGSRPIEALAEALLARGTPAAADGGAPTQALPELADGDRESKTPAALAASLRSGGEAAVHAIIRALDRIGADEQARGGFERPLRADLLLVVDPLDDLFGTDVPAADRAAFAGLLRALVASERIWVVATLRAALYEPFLREDDLKALKEWGADYNLAPPDPAQLVEIVRKPADAAGLVYETNAAGERLDERLLRDAAGTDTLPPLQFTLQRLFIERQISGPERRLTFAAYDALGGIGSAIDRAAERALDGAGESEALPGLLYQLAIPVHEGSTLVVRAAPLIDAAPDAAARRLVDALVEARILLHSNERGVPIVRVAHQRVLESWRRAREIVTGNFAVFRVRDEAEDRRVRVRQRVSMSAAAVFAVLAVVAGWQYLDARAAKQAAEQSEKMAVSERRRAELQWQLAEGRRTEAEEQRAAAEKQQGEAEQQRGIAQKREEGAVSQRSLAETGRRQAEEQRNQALIAQSRFLADLADRTYQAGDDMTAALLALEALPDEQSGIVRPFVSEAELSLERAWRGPRDERVPREAQILSGHAGPVLSCALSSDGLRAVTGSSDRSVRVWNTQTGESTAQLQDHAADVTYVSFSADGTKIVTGAEDGVRVWDAASGSPFAFLPQRRSLIAISEDGQGVISTSAQNRVHLWDAKSGQELTRTLGGTILGVRFGPEGARVLAAADNSIEVHEAASGRRLRVLRGHWKKALNAAFSPDGQRIASIGDDQTARIWSLADGRQLFFVSDPKLNRDVAIRMGAERVLVPFASGWRLYAINGARLLADLSTHDREASIALFNPSEKLIVTASSAASTSAPTLAPTLSPTLLPTWAKLWDGASGKELAALEQGSTATCIGFSRDGRRLLTGTRNGIARVWSFDRDPDPAGRAAPTASDLVEQGKAQVRRCLTREQREKAFLAPEPPAWCIEMAKWPYDTQAWKDWLRYKRANADPPRPDTPEWQSWLASAIAGRGEPK